MKRSLLILALVAGCGSSSKQEATTGQAELPSNKTTAAAVEKPAKPQTGKVSDSHVPERPTRDDIKSGIGPIRAKIATCADKHKFRGVFKVWVEVGPDGSVHSASPSVGIPGFRECVVKAFRLARFPKTREGARFRYPFRIR